MFAKKILATGLALVVTLGLAACDPPMPPELLAAQAEKTVTCVDGSLTLSSPEAIADVVDGWLSAIADACPATTVTKVGAADTAAQAVISMDGQVSKECKAFATVPIAFDGGVIAYALADAPTLVLTPQNVQDIFSGKLTNWSDPSLAAANPDAVLPNLPINIIGGPQQIAVDSIKAWFKKLGTSFDPSLIKVAATDTGAALATMNEGDIAITSFSNALYAYSTTAAIAVGKSVANADVSGIQMGADSSLKPTPGAKIIGYGAVFPVNLYLCGADNLVARAVARFLIRQDQQGALGAAIVAPLPESVRLKAAAQVSKGLPKPKN